MSKKLLKKSEKLTLLEQKRREVAHEQGVMSVIDTNLDILEMLEDLPELLSKGIEIKADVTAKIDEEKLVKELHAIVDAVAGIKVYEPKGTVKVSNLSDIKIITKDCIFPSEIKIKNLKDIPKTVIKQEVVKVNFNPVISEMDKLHNAWMERFTKFSNGLRDKNIPIKVQQVDSKGKVVNQSGSVIMGGGDTGFYKPETSTLGDFIAQNMTLISSTGGTFTKNDLSVQEYDENETSTGFRGSMMMGEVATGNRAETVKMDQNDNVKVNVQAITGVPKFTVENALTSTGFDLNAAPYSQTTNITEDYLLNNLRLEFTTTESKTITVTSANGTKLWERTTTALDVSVPFDNAMDATDEVTVAVTQTAGACSMDLTLTIKKGDVTVGDNAVLGAGNNLIGTVRDFLIEVGRGTIPNNGSMLKFGENPDIDTGGFEDIWDAGGTYVPPTQARVHDVVSSTGSDAGVVTSSGTATAAGSIVLTDTGATFISDGVNVGDAVLDDTDMEIGQVTAVTSETELAIAGGMRSPMDGAFGAGFTVGDNYRVVTNSSTGASIFYIEGLDASFLEQDEFVVLDGTTPVSTVGSYIRQFRARVFGRGTTGAIGTITSTAQVDGTISCQVIDGNNQTLMAIYTVPANKKGYLLKWWGSLSKKQGAVSNMRLRIGTLGAIGYLVQTRAVDNGGSSEFVYERTVPSLLPAGIDIWVEADTDTNNTGVSSGFDILLVEST